eukprot:TRINITY_DN59135_c0_g1_i1.p1 TRINITY_DN59135_c0_g1~~TRINITY_DN59135_c0_g1_i1.p1  ORF type:complete len:178 (-),score=14.07 TRINITY_DN59135_c0_g1_i1:233-766(-)
MLSREGALRVSDHASQRDTSHLTQSSFYSELDTTFSMNYWPPSSESEFRASFIDEELPSVFPTRVRTMSELRQYMEHLRATNGAGLPEGDTSSPASSSTSQWSTDESFRSSWSDRLRSSRASARSHGTHPVVQHLQTERNLEVLPLEQFVASARALLDMARRNEREGATQDRHVPSS